MLSASLNKPFPSFLFCLVVGSLVFSFCLSGFMRYYFCCCLFICCCCWIFCGFICLFVLLLFVYLFVFDVIVVFVDGALYDFPSLPFTTF